MKTFISVLVQTAWCMGWAVVPTWCNGGVLSFMCQGSVTVFVKC